MKLFTLVVVVVMAAMLVSTAFAVVPAPLAMDSKAIGGGALNQYTPGIEGGNGVNNIGLLIKTWGEVTFVDATNKYFYINDGQNKADGSLHQGIRVSYDNLAAGVTINPPAIGSYVVITGISSTVIINTKVQPNLLPRRQADIQIVLN